MFCRRFMFTAVLAVVGAMIAPATSQADFFVVQVYVDNSLVATINGQKNPISGLWSASSSPAADTYGTANDFVTVDFSAQSNMPGTPAGSFVLDTTTNVTLGGSASTGHDVKLVAGGTPFTAPGQSGDTLYLTNTITSLSGFSGPNASGLDVYGMVDQDSNLATTGDQTRTGFHSYSTTGSTSVTSTSSFVRGSSYALGTVIDMNLAAGTSGQVTSQAMVHAPAPPALILLAGAVPFVGLLRRWRKKPAVEAEATPVAA